MAKHKSRAKRASEQADAWRTIANKLRDLVNDLGSVPIIAGQIDAATAEAAEDQPDPKAVAKILEQAQQVLADFDAGELDALREELENWRDNLSGANMEHLPKYAEVEEAADTLSNIDADQPDLSDADDIELVADDLESRADELEGVSFPGMF